MSETRGRPTGRQDLSYEHLLWGERASIIIRSAQPISGQWKDWAVDLLTTRVNKSHRLSLSIVVGPERG